MRREARGSKNATSFVDQAHQLLPSVRDLISRLQECRRERNTESARCLHILLCECGLECRALLGNHLVRVFVESGKLPAAKLVFERLVDRDEDSWTSFMHGCIDYGHAQHALHLYHKMQEDGLPCNSISLFRTLLKACTKLRDDLPAQFFHFDVVKLGFESDPFLGSALVDMYAKCGSLSSACDVFNRLQDRDVVLWTTIIAGFIEQGLVDEGLKYLEAMQVEGISPNAVTFSCLLKGCASKEFLRMAYQVHVEIIKHGFEKESCVDSTLVGVYAKCGCFVEAETLFQEVSARDVILWTALIAAYADQGFGDSALHCLDEMEGEGVSPNAITYMCSLKALGDINARDKVHQIHSQIVIRGLESSPSVGGTLVFTYGKCRMLEDSYAVLNGLPIQDAFSCNSLILAYTEQGLDYDALDCVEKMQAERVALNAFTFVCILKVCGRQRLIEKGLWLHDEIIREEFELDAYVACALVDMYGKCGFFLEAWAVVEEASAQNTATWTALIAGLLEHGHYEEALHCLGRVQGDDMPLDSVMYICGLKACGGAGALEEGQKLHSEIVKDGHEKEPLVGNTLIDMYAKCGFLTEAQDVFEELPVQQVVSWTALLSGYLELKLFEKVLELYGRIPLERLTLDSVVFVSGLKACGNLGALERGQMIHADISREGFEEDPVIMSSLVDMYAKCGCLVEAMEAFDGMFLQNIVLWTALITGFACQGDSKAVFYMLDRLKVGGMQPDAVTLLNVVAVCSHVGLVEKGLTFFEAVNFSQDASIELYNCLLDIVSRAGQLNAAFTIAKEMPFQPNLVTWNTILGACQKWRSVQLGELAFQCALSLDCKQPAPYASMICIYADAQMWEDVKRIDGLRQVACVYNSASTLMQQGILYAL